VNGPAPASTDPARPPFPLREAHAHLYQYGRSLGMIELSACRSPADLLEAFAQQRRSDRAAGVLIGHGARPESWDPPRWPSVKELDRAAGGAAALAWCFDYHSLLANSAMLTLAGVDDRTPDPPGGIIERNELWEPTGVLLESAAQRVWQCIPESPESPDLEFGCIELAKLGFVEVHDLKSQPWLGKSLSTYASWGELQIHCKLFPLVDDLDQVLASRGEWECDQVRIGGAKIFVDGTLNSRTAWMLHPYVNGRPDHPRGTPMMTPGQIEDAVRRCDAAGMPLAAHAIGDAAVRAVLDAIERVRPRATGFRIEHAEVVDEADVPRFAALGVIASVQPCHLLYDIEALRRGLPHRLHRVLPLRELIDSGCIPGETLLFGSDVPIVRPDPEDSILAATARRRPGMGVDDAIAPEQAISVSEAWRCFG
jgi:predicted amidohydrolase YtcJ